MQICKANGCTLQAEFITDWHLDKDGKNRPRWGVCYYHRMAKPEDWGRVTDRLRQYGHVAQGIRILASLNDPMFLPEPDEPYGCWLTRVDDMLSDLIFGQAPKKTGDDGFAELRRILGG